MRQLLINIRNDRHRLRGFTIVELLVVLGASGVLAAIMFGPMNELYLDNARGTKSVIKTTDVKGALRSIERGITLSNGFSDGNGILADPTGRVWNWQGDGAEGRVLITSTYATDRLPSSDPTNQRLLVKSTGCTTPLSNNVIYFVDNEKLYRRTIKNPTLPANTCGGLTIAQTQTCDAANMSLPACRATDALILSGVTNFRVSYYADPTDVIPQDPGGPTGAQYTLHSAATSVVPSLSDTVVITVTARSGPGAIDTTSTSKIRITRVNGT